MTAQAVARLLVYMRSHDYTHAIPDRQGKVVDSRPVVDPAAGYVTRSLNELPKSGTERQWSARRNYVLERTDALFDDPTESMTFGRAVQSRVAGTANVYRIHPRKIGTQ